LKSHRAVEALRIALGLSTGENPLTIVLLGEAVRLIAEDIDDIVDTEILEKHRPVFAELKTPFVIEHGHRLSDEIDESFTVREASPEAIADVIASADRVLSFP
jgi:hypothetical protein